MATPFFIPAVHGVQEIVAEFKQNSDWMLTVLTGLGQPVIAYQGQGTSLYVAWDGRDALGNEVPDGVYDYLIEAHPTIGGGGAQMASGSSTTLGTEVTEGSAQKLQPVPPSDAALAQRAVRFTTAKVPPTTTFPNARMVPPAADRNPRSLRPPPSEAPQSSLSQAPYPRTAAEAVAAGTDTYCVEPPPMPRVKKDGKWYSWEELYGPLSPTPVKVPPNYGKPSTQNEDNSDLADNGAAPLDVPDPGQTTSTPTRIPGSMFKGFAGVFGTGYQGHHPSWQDVGFFSMPSSTSGHTSRWAPYGKLKNAGAIANAFAGALADGGLRRAFDLADTPFRWFHLTGCWTGDCDREHNPPVLFPGKFGAGCELGLLVGHMIAVEDSPFFASHSYTPLWNPDESNPLSGTWRSYNWVALPEMDFGQSASVLRGFPPLKWMGLYGCHSLRYFDIDDMWTKFLLPFPPNMRVLLGADSSVWIHPAFGSAFGYDLRGIGGPANAMTVIDAWYDAGTLAHRLAANTQNPFKRPGTVVLTAVFRLSTKEGAGTYNDKIFDYPPFIDTEWTSIDWERRTVYTP